MTHTLTRRPTNLKAIFIGAGVIVGIIVIIMLVSPIRERDQARLNAQNRQAEAVRAKPQEKPPGPSSATRPQSTAGIAIEMVRIPGGTFMMGSDSGESAEEPVHQVTVDGFYMGKYEVTQGQWKAVMGGAKPSYFKGDDLPVENVSWNDIKEFIQELNQKTDQRYRLPTEAEWEYACRAGTTDDRYGEVDEIAWYDKNSDEETHPVGEKEANAWDLYDMLGNVWEWCADWYYEDYYYYKNGPTRNPEGPDRGSDRVYRGGSWSNGARYVRAAYRDYRWPSFVGAGLGFRLARD